MGTIKNSLCFLSLCAWFLIVSFCSALASSPSEIKEAFPQLEIGKSLFTSGELSSQVKIIQSPYNHKPEGVGITYKLDPNKRYLVSITGQVYKIRPQLIIQIVGAPDRILPAPNGEIFINVFNTPEVTLFLNIHPKIKYQLNSIQYHECPQCVDRKELIHLIQKEKPQLEILLKQDLLLASESILDWTANVTPFALSKPFLAKTNNLNRMTPEEIYNLFNLNLAAVYCGGSSLFLNKVLALFGINSFTLDFGDVNDFLTHTTVVVANRSSGHWKYYIFDPTFNFTFQNSNSGYFLTFSELLDLPPTNIKHKIKINQRSLHKRKFLALREDAKLCQKVKETTQSYLSCSVFDYTLKRYFFNVNPLYVKNGYSRNLSGFLQLLRKKIFTIGGLSKQNSRNRFMEILKTHEIPIGYGS
ncbi:MAG: hypothetical protein IH886_07575 [Nitrospinae bacterium]|nr:hypothetical protein [Nitrospinota bacterium]